MEASSAGSIQLQQSPSRAAPASIVKHLTDVQTCAVCLSALGIGGGRSGRGGDHFGRIVLLHPCQHAFCSACLASVVEHARAAAASRCPLCRARIVPPRGNGVAPAATTEVHRIDRGMYALKGHLKGAAQLVGLHGTLVIGTQLQEQASMCKSWAARHGVRPMTPPPPTPPPPTLSRLRSRIYALFARLDETMLQIDTFTLPASALAVSPGFLSHML